MVPSVQPVTGSSPDVVIGHDTSVEATAEWPEMRRREQRGSRPVQVRSRMWLRCVRGGRVVRAFGRREHGPGATVRECTTGVGDCRPQWSFSKSLADLCQSSAKYEATEEFAEAYR